MRPVLRVDNLTYFMCRLSWNLLALILWKPQGLCRPVMGMIYFYTVRGREIDPTSDQFNEETRFYVIGLMKSENNNNWLGCRIFNVNLQSLIIWREVWCVVCHECICVYWGFISWVQNINSHQCVTLFTVLITCLTMRAAMPFFVKTLLQITLPILCVTRDFRCSPPSRWELRSSYRRIQANFRIIDPWKMGPVDCLEISWRN